MTRALGFPVTLDEGSTDSNIPMNLGIPAITIDGTGLGITHIAVGSLRYRVTFKGPGGHSYGAFGLSNPLHALGRAVETISRFEVPSDPKTTFNVGRVGGGTSVNAIPFESWFEMDMRPARPRRPRRSFRRRCQ